METILLLLPFWAVPAPSPDTNRVQRYRLRCALLQLFWRPFKSWTTKRCVSRVYICNLEVIRIIAYPSKRVLIYFWHSQLIRETAYSRNRSITCVGQVYQIIKSDFFTIFYDLILTSERPRVEWKITWQMWSFHVSEIERTCKTWKKRTSYFETDHNFKIKICLWTGLMLSQATSIIKTVMHARG